MKSGVYRITHTKSNKSYIGSSIDILKRWDDHHWLLRSQKHHSIHLQRAWNKYGGDAFVFEILLYCDPEHCLMYEQVALDHFKPEYNICKIAGSTLGIKPSPEAIEKNRQSQLGRKHSKQTIEKMRKAQLGLKHPMYGKHHTTASNLQRSISLAGENGPAAKLTTEQVRQIRLLLVSHTCASLARQFGVSDVLIGKIKRREIWKNA